VAEFIAIADGDATISLDQGGIIADAEGTGADINRQRIAGERTCLTSRTIRKPRRAIRRDRRRMVAPASSNRPIGFTADIEKRKK
jgi:hypothetical protein